MLSPNPRDLSRRYPWATAGERIALFASYSWLNHTKLGKVTSRTNFQNLFVEFLAHDRDNWPVMTVIDVPLRFLFWSKKRTMKKVSMFFDVYICAHFLLLVSVNWHFFWQVTPMMRRLVLIRRKTEAPFTSNRLIIKNVVIKSFHLKL